MTPQEEPRLRTAPGEASEKLEKQISKGAELLARQVETDGDLEKLSDDRGQWSDYSEQLLIRLFTTNLFAIQFSNSATAPGSGLFDDLIEAEQKHIKSKLSFLRSLSNRLELLDDNLNDARQPNARTENKPVPSLTLEHLHPEIFSKCHALYKPGTYAEAVEKGFKVVRDKLRKLTGYEKGSEAFGKGKLYIKGAAAANVDNDFNEGVKFLTMAIDQFRNEKSHTSDAKIEDPIRAYEYLVLSSLALRFLDAAEVRKL